MVCVASELLVDPRSMTSCGYRTLATGLLSVVVGAERPQHLDAVVLTVSDVVALLSRPGTPESSVPILGCALIAVEAKALLAKCRPVRRQIGAAVRAFPVRQGRPPNVKPRLGPHQHGEQ